MAKKEARRDGRPGEPSAIVSWWLGEFEAVRKREKAFRENGKRVLQIYGGDEPETTPFNILFSNTETMLPALYSSTPRPVVNRRFKDDDPIGKQAAEAGKRVLEFLVDTNVEGYETYDEVIRSSVLSALLPGRGLACVKYDADVRDDYKASELVCLESRPWDSVYIGYARKWSKVPWIAYEDYIDRDEAQRLFGGDVAAKMVFTADEGEKDREDKDDEKKKHLGDRRVARIYQIWDKNGGADGKRKIRYISPAYLDGYLKVEDDPLGLTGFFNCPRPLQFIEKPHDQNPVAPYVLYENQAKELNRLTLRINRIAEAIKARGAYDASLGDEIAKMMSGDDNTMVPADSASTLSAEKGLGNAIWFMPIEQLVAVLTQLYQAREQCKRVIYEIMGIADILRGSSAASETLGAQTIKERWGTLRLKRLQNDVQRYARDFLRMMLELAATKFSEDTWAKMTGLPFVTGDRRGQIEQVARAAQQQASQMQATGQQPTPQQLQQVQQIQAEMAKPVWPQVLGALKDDVQRAYKIDIETNSTIEPEATEDQKGIAELMNALGQYMNGVGPLVAQGVMPFGAAKSMLLAISRRFRFGSEIEDEIQAMQPPKPQDDGKAAAEQAKMQVEQQRMQADQQKMQFDQQQAQAKEQREQAVEVARHTREAQSEQNRVAAEQNKLNAEVQKEAMKIEAAKQAKLAELRAERSTAEMKAKIEQDTELRKADIQAKTQILIARIGASEKTGDIPDTDKGPDAPSLVQTILSALQEQSAAHSDMMAKMMQTISAPRKRRAIRGSDGRIAETVEETMWQ